MYKATRYHALLRVAARTTTFSWYKHYHYDALPTIIK